MMDNELEAQECYILMKKEYRISRNIRAEWYLNRINSLVTMSRKSHLNDFDGELEVISVLPVDPPPEWDSDTAHEYKYLITEKTHLHFLSQKYRLVLCLDLSPSLSVVNIEKGKVVFDEIFPTLEKCLKGVVRSFVVPGSQLVFFPKIYVTIIAHTPFFKSQPQQVIVQGWLLVNEKENMESFLRNVHLRLIRLQNQLAQLTIEAYTQKESNCDLQDEQYSVSEDINSHPMISPDIGFVNMLRYGIVALQLLPQNSTAGIIVITDGVISLPDATMFDALLVQLRNLTISCSFLQIGTIYKPHAGLGYISFNDLMMFLANATFGVYFTDLPTISDGYENEINEYHKAFLTWSFQKGLDEINGNLETENYFSQLPLISESSLRIRKQERKVSLRATLNAVLSCRLREGYTIKNVKISTDFIELILVLAWKYSITIEYHIRSVWPPTQSEVQTEVWIEASYEFLSDISGTEGNCGSVRSYYRERMVKKYLNTLQDLKETDLLLVNLQSFPSNPQFYTVPDCVQKGMPVFYIHQQSSCPEASSDLKEHYPQFANFWLPICMLNINKWQKWMHTHRIGVILKHETPLPRNLHMPNASGRYGTVHCQNSELTLTSFLASWTDFILIENNSYIKFLYKNEEDASPSSFFVVRIISNRPPCLAIRLAFLGGTACQIRDKVVGELEKKIQQLTVRIRERSRERKAIDGSQKVNINGSSANSVLCCSITHKPIEKIIIWHDRIPPNLFSSQVQESTPRFMHSFIPRPGWLSKSASDNQALLCRYLHHRRWIWGLQSPFNPALSTNAIMKILDTLTRMRLEEGFKFAYSRNGIVNLIKEFEMKLDLHYSIGGSEKHLDESDITSHCMVQYIMFPPHYANPKDGLEEDGDETESVEADAESQLITECWVEPQNGIVQESSDSINTWKGRNYKQLASSFYLLDQECIWGLLTFEFLSQICQDESYNNFSSCDPTFSRNSPTNIRNNYNDNDPIQQIPFRFHLTNLLSRCQRAEILLSTLFHDLYYSLCNSTNTYPNRANDILYNLILDHLTELNNGRQFYLSSFDNFNLPEILSQRPRDLGNGCSPFNNINMDSMKEVPVWRCFLKFITSKHFLITLLPASFQDLKLLLGRRDNILDENTNFVRMIDKAEHLSNLEILLLEEPMEFEESSYDKFHRSNEVYCGVTQSEKKNPSSYQQQSFTSTSSTISSRSSSAKQDATDKAHVNKSQEKCHASRQLFQYNVPQTEEAIKRTRFRSGPALGNQMSYQFEPLEQSLEYIEPRRGRAYSLHSNTDAAPSKKGKISLATTPTKEEKISFVGLENNQESYPFSSGNEKLRKRNISMPSKCHKEMGARTIYNKSFSVEAMKENELHSFLFSDRDSTIPPTLESSQLTNHDPIYGSIVLPIYCFDCKLETIIKQFVNKTKEVDIGKDIYVNSTFNLEVDSEEDDEDNNDLPEKIQVETLVPPTFVTENTSAETISSTSTITTTTTTTTALDNADKYPSPEPLSEESDILSSDAKCLKNLVESIEKCQRRSFVMGVFEALSNNLYVHPQDVQAALDQCQEIFLETDITNYLQTICGHIKDFRMRYFLRQKKHLDALYNIHNQDNTIKKKEDIHPTKMFPLALLNEHQPNDNLSSIHCGIREKFADILQSQFKPVPGMPDYYYYYPRFGSYSQAESNRYKVSSLQLRLKKRSGGESYVDEDHIEGDERAVLGDEDVTLFSEDEDKDKSIEFRTDNCNYGRNTLRYTTQSSHVSHGSQIEFEEGQLSEGVTSEGGSFPPLYLHLTCTIRSNGHVIGTTSISSLPTCLREVTHCIKESELQLSKICVTLDVLVMTLIGAADICPWDIQKYGRRERSRRTISGCSNLSSIPRYSESTGTSTSESEEAYLKEEELLNHLPEDQYKAVISTFDMIKWLIQDEIVSSLLHCYPTTEEMLHLVASHVSESLPSPVCYSESVPLNFVFGMEQSMNKFMEEFKNLKIFGYQLEKIGNFYYLAVSPDSNRLRNLFSLVPPLGLKTPTPDISNKTMDSKNLSLVSAPIEGLSEEENASTTQDDIPQKSQKVSFGLTSTESIAKEHESPKAESKKGSKLMRKKRRERRDSERRGVLGSSDSEEDASSTTKDLSVYKLDSKFMVPNKLITEEQNDLSSVNKNKTALDKNMTLKIESEDKNNVKVTSLEVPLGEEKSGTNSEFKKDTTAEMLALKPVERIRCGSINLPRTQVNKTEVIRKSASTDDFSPSIHDNEETRLLHSSPAMWNEVSRSKHSSCDGSKISSDHSKSRHSSGGEILKSRHNSGTGSIMGLYSDVSSLFESGQTTEDGCEGDISDLEESTDWITDLDAPQPPEFWILIKIDSVIQTYFHCRRDLDVEQCKAVHKEVVRLLKDQIKLVNQRLLLQDLYDCRICNHLLEPETSEDVWRHEDMKDLEGENSEYLEAAMKFKLGAFACRQVWTKKFELHPRLKLSGKGGMKGIYTLKKTLNPFMVTNRKNMFVYEDSSGVGTNVFYLRLHEKQTPTYGSAVMETRKDDSLSRSSSVVSLGKKQNRDDEIGFQGERRSFIEKDVIVEGVPSTTCQRRNQQDYIILTVHGIAEPGIDIKEKLVQMLQKRLDDAVLDAICLMLWDNPHHKLSSEDVHFIQPPYQPPSKILKFLVNVYALPYVQALCYYLRQNMISCGFTPPKYMDTKPENHFQDFSATDQDPTTEANIFLYVCSQKSGTKGLACLALSVIDSHGNAYKKGFNSVSPNAFEEILSETEFEIMTQTGQHIAENDNGFSVVFQFKVWECGRLEFEEMGKCLEEAIKHALWDLSTEYRFLVAPITLSSVLAVSQPSTPVKAGPRMFGSPKNSSQDRCGSPVQNHQAILRLKNPSVAGMQDMRFTSRRSSLNVTLGHMPLLENIQRVTASKSPSKGRHSSIDFGKEHMPRFDNKMKIEDPSAVDAELKFSDSSPEPLHSIFCHIILKWFEYGIQMNVPTIKKHVIVCPTRCALPVFLNELQKWLHYSFSDNTTKFFKKNLDGVYTRIDITKESQLMKSQINEKSENFDIIVTSRNEKEWRTVLFEKDILELNNQVHKGSKNKKFDSHIVTHHSSFEQAGSENGALNSGYASSPTAPHGPNSHSDSIPISQSHPLFKYREVSTTNSIFIHRQLFFLATLRDDELTVYTYNWMKELYEMLHNLLNRLCQWTFARKCLLSSLVLQKLGLFHNEPFVRKDYEIKDESSKKESDKKEVINPFVQNVHYIESLIKSTYPGRDSLGPKERSGRRGQNQTSLQNLSEVLRDSAPPKPLINCNKSGHRNLLQKHGMQMAEVTRLTIQREKERSTLQSMIQSQTATTPIFTDVTLSLFKKHARITHFCLTPLLFLPKWRAEVAAVTDHSFPDYNSQGYQETFSQGKISETRSRHESGASAKVPHLELRRSSSVGLPASGLSSPNQNRRRHPTLGGEDKWHDALCLSYLKEFIHYLHCLGFTTLCIQETPKQSGRGQGNFNVKEEPHEVKIPDQDISTPTYLVRHVFGGTVLLQINFVEPYFSVMGYTLEASRTQPKKLKNKSQNNTFIDEVELIRILLHMHSFTYDYHLRAVCVYVADRQLLFARGYHLSSFLSDFIKYYRKGPNFARNLIQSGEVRIEDTGTPGEQLYNYLLAREKEYQMKVLRMTPVMLDFTSDRQTEFVLVHTKAYRFPFNEENEQRDGDDYDVTLLVSHDTNVSDNDSNLNLKFYVILTSRREMYPNRNSEGKNGRFRTVSTADTIEQIRKAAEHEPSVAEETTTDFLITAGGSNASSNTSSCDSESGQNTSVSSKQGAMAAKIPRKTPLISMRQESVNYLGYFSDYEMHMQQILEQQVTEARERILHIFNTAKIHCRRDSLWQKLMWGLKEEERLKSSKEQSSHILTFNEFSELLNLVSVKSISVLDPQLLPLVSKPLQWYHSLARLLSAKYQDNHNYGSRILTSSDGNIQYVVVYSLGCPDACMMISQNVFIQRADICCVRKNSESEKLEARVQIFFQDFINCCCFHLWSGLI